ncbi:MAG: LacI family transcriptional regulator [Planctomycetota bacterium]
MEQKELARLLGVSTATISMALRGKGRLSPELREKILALSYKHGVGVRRFHEETEPPPRPAPFVRIGYCGLGHHLGWFHSGSFRGLAEAAGAVRHEVLLKVADVPYGGDRAEAAARVRASLTDARLDGLIVDPTRELIDALRDVALPKVLLGYYNLAPGTLDAVVPDNVDGAYRLARRLIERGCRTLALVQCMPDDWNSKEKLQGFRMALDEAGLPFDANRMVAGNFSLGSGARAAAELLSRGTALDGILIGNDWLSGPFVRAWRERGGADVAFAHFGDSMLDPEIYPCFDRVDLAIDTMGRQALKLLLDRIAGLGPREPLTVKVAPLFRAAEAPPAEAL